jgi:hypothetical protein
LGLAVCLLQSAAFAQFPSELVSFEEGAVDTPTAKEIFLAPQASGSTSGIVPNVSGEDNNGSFRTVSGFGASDGSRAYQVFWSWQDAANPEAWVRLTSFNASSRPNPSLDTRGLVRFDIQNIGSFINGEFGLCLGIRETGIEVAQLDNGGTTGAIEWVGVDPTINAIIEPETGGDAVASAVAAGDDVQEVAVGMPTTPGQVVISPGGNGVIDSVVAGDDVTRYGYFRNLAGTRVPVPAVTIPVAGGYRTFEVDLATGDVTYDGVTTPGAIVAFANGNGVLDPPNFRGTLEHLAITNVTTDTATGMLFLIDALQFEATVPDPVDPPTVIAPVFDSDVVVEVQCDVGATSSELFLNDVSQGTAVPDGITGIATFAGLTLEVGDELRATQTVGGVTSGLSGITSVVAEGTALAENFDSYASQAEFNQFWSNSIANPTPATARLTLTSGSAASCENVIREFNPAGSDAARLYRNFGSLNGTDAEPLLVTWKFKHSVQSGNARTRLELARFASGQFSTATGDPGTTGIGLFNEVVGDLITNYAVIIRFTDFNNPLPGFVSSGARSYAPSTVARTAGEWRTMQIEVKSTVINYYIDGVLANPTGYEAGVPRPNSDPYQYIIVGQGFSNNGPQMFFDDISVTIGDAPLPFGPANDLNSPSILGELYPGVTEVELTGVDEAAAEVTIYADDRDTIVGTLSGPFPGGTAVVPVAELEDGQLIYATQSTGGPSYICDATALSSATCLGDTDGNGVVNAADRGQISANIGQTGNDQVCLFDLDGNGAINAADRGQVSANIGLCTALPNYMNGSGLNAAGDGPDPRFPGTPGEESCFSAAVAVSVPAPSVQAVLVPGQVTVDVSGVIAGVASEVVVYANELTEIGSVLDPATDTVSIPVTALVNGDVITATQIIGNESVQSAGVTVRVPAPTLLTDINANEEEVTVSGLHPLATTVTVYVNGSPVSEPTGGNSVVVVEVATLNEDDSVVATQTIAGIESPDSNTKIVQPVYCLLAFEDDFDVDTSASWTILQSSADTAATFAWDYSALDIPPAPNSDGTTFGLKLEANMALPGTIESITVLPTGESYSGNYLLRFDMWMNVNGPLPGGGTGSTEFLTAGLGHDSVTNNFHTGTSGTSTGAGGWFAVSGEGGSTRDFRAYKNNFEQFAESGQFAASTSSAGGGAHNNTTAYYATTFPGNAPPVQQQIDFPQQTGTAAAGTPAFGWYQVEVRRTGTRVRWSINGLRIAELDQNIGTTVFALDGNIAIGYLDPFTSVSDNPALSFGVIDNVRVYLEAAQCETGACCDGGVCSDTDEGSCSGTFFGLGTECASTVCP